MRLKIAAFLLAGAMAFSLASCGGQDSSSVSQDSNNSVSILGQSPETGDKYTLYLGLNDKDTYEQKISTEDAIDKANQICAAHSGGYTQFTARGGWTNDDGTLGHENTLVYMIYDISESDLKAILDEFIKDFNQSSVLVEKSETAHIYYSGQ